MDIGKNIDSAGVNNQKALELAAKINAGKYAKKKIENSSTTEFFIKSRIVRTKIRNAYNKESYKAAMNHSVTSNFVDEAIKNLTNREVTNGNKKEMLQQLQNLKVKLQLEEITKDLTNPKIPYEKKIATLQNFKAQILNNQETKNLVWALEKLDIAKNDLMTQQFDKSAGENIKAFAKSLNIDTFSQKGIDAVGKKTIDSDQILGEGANGTVFATKMKTGGNKRDVIVKKSKGSANLIEEFQNSQKLIDGAKENMLKPAYDKNSQKDGNLLAYQQGLQSIALTKGIGTDDVGLVYTVQDKIKGKDLSSEKITSNKPYENGFVDNPQAAVQRAAGFLLGVVSIHEQGLVHKDIKPENLMIENNPDSNYAAKIIDLGSLDSVKDPKNKTFDGVTAGFRPPELYKKIEDAPANYTPQQEMFAVGMTLPSLLFGAACNGLIDSHLNNKKNLDGSTRFPWHFNGLTTTFIDKPHSELQKFMRDEFTKINNSQVENGNTGYPQEVIDQLGNLVADCLMMKPKFMYDKDNNLIQNNKDLDIGPYKNEATGETLRRPTSEEALQILTNLGLSDWEAGHFSIQ